MPLDFGESKIYRGALEKSLYKPALIWKSFSSDWSPRLYFLLLTHDQSLKLGTVTCRVKSTSVFSVTFKFHTPDKLARQGKKLPAPLKFLWSRLKNYLHTSTKEIQTRAEAWEIMQCLQSAWAHTQTRQRFCVSPLGVPRRRRCINIWYRSSPLPRITQLAGNECADKRRELHRRAGMNANPPLDNPHCNYNACCWIIEYPRLRVRVFLARGQGHLSRNAADIVTLRKSL